MKFKEGRGKKTKKSKWDHVIKPWKVWMCYSGLFNNLKCFKVYTSNDNKKFGIEWIICNSVLYLTCTINIKRLSKSERCLLQTIIILLWTNGHCHLSSYIACRDEYFICRQRIWSVLAFKIADNFFSGKKIIYSEKYLQKQPFVNVLKGIK